MLATVFTSMDCHLQSFLASWPPLKEVSRALGTEEEFMNRIDQPYCIAQFLKLSKSSGSTGISLISWVVSP